MVNVKHAVACANGTDALLLVLKAWDIGPGDAVFVPAFTFAATAEVVALAGASPVFVDVEDDTFNISLSEPRERARDGAQGRRAAGRERSFPSICSGSPPTTAGSNRSQNARTC